MIRRLDEDEPEVSRIRDLLSMLRTEVVQGANAFVERVQRRLAAVDEGDAGPTLTSAVVDAIVEFANLVTRTLGVEPKDGRKDRDDRNADP